MKIDSNSYSSLALVYFLSTVIGFALWLWVDIAWIVWPACVALIWFCVWQTTFFRVPSRFRSEDDALVTSVADGRVVIVDRVVEQEFLHCECIQVSVYMNFFDVHANFWPCDGTLINYSYVPGKHLFAFRPKASLENEHSLVYVENRNGYRLLFKQIAGGFARRVVCYGSNGQTVRAGKQCGIIKFGSRIDLFLPLDAEIKVGVGELVRACETVIAVMP